MFVNILIKSDVSEIKSIFFELEVSLLSWRNNFVCDIIGDKGSVHINSLCKWGPSKFIKRKRVFPSGKPDEKITMEALEKEILK